MKDRRKETGRLGEELALDYLLDKDYQLVAKNYHCPLGEIDLIVFKDKIMVFVEVRTRRSTRFGLPEESIRHAKKDRIRRVAQYYLKNHYKTDIPVRFDVLTVILGAKEKVNSINHIEAAF